MADTHRRIRVAVLYGGRSAEHDVSVMSASNVVGALDPKRYEVVPIFVTRTGEWIRGEMPSGGRLPRPANGAHLCLLPGGGGRLLSLPADGVPVELPRIDILFPVLHGLGGEDGAVQGLAEVAGVPLAGCGILGSATALDKEVAKRLLAEAGLPVARSITLWPGHVPPFADLALSLGLPFFVKPARQGSSVGVGKVSDESQFATVTAEAFRHDRKLLAETFMPGREIECSVLEDEAGGLFVSRPGEIVPANSHGFYSYEAKYLDADGAVLRVPAALERATETRIRDAAGSAFRALGCDGMARVDFFVDANGGFVVNEVNTIPGFTDISMYPKAMAASGVPYPELLDRLIAHGLASGLPWHPPLKRQSRRLRVSGSLAEQLRSATRTEPSAWVAAAPKRPRATRSLRSRLRGGRARDQAPHLVDERLAAERLGH